MIDPSNALKLFQNDLLANKIPLQRGNIDSNLFVCFDEPNGRHRFTYMRLEGRIITALIMFVAVDPFEDSPCFNIGYAVPKAYQKQGRAKEAVNAAISEMKAGLGRAGILSFYVEAIVSTDNQASNNVAANTISPESKDIIDEISGLTALQYIRRIDCKFENTK